MRGESGGKDAGARGDDAERRGSARAPVEMWVEEIGTESQVFRRAGNLSTGGLHLDRTIPIAVGTQVDLRFTLPGEDVPIRTFGRIVSIDPTQELGMGVKFVDLPADAAARIDAFVSRALTPIEGVPHT